MKKSMGVISPIMGKANIVPFSNLVSVLQLISKKLSVICICHEGLDDLCKKDKGSHSFIFKRCYNDLSKIINFFKLQKEITKILICERNINVWIYYLASIYIIPIMVNKLLNKKSILILGGSLEVQLSNKRNLQSTLMLLAKNINLRLVDGIIVYSPSLIQQWDLEKYRCYIHISHQHFLDFDKFKMEKPVSERDNLIGYIGRLSEEKGSLNFAKAIPKILEGNCKFNFCISGDGDEHNEVKIVLNGIDFCDKVKLTGWIPHNELPEHLNRLKLFILPSYSEGLPNIMLEAMACGTPVLATPVGAIPDIIKDGETGFLMENNSPECIAANVIRALKHPDFEGVAERGRALVEREFTFEKAVEMWQEILEEVGARGR